MFNVINKNLDKFYILIIVFFGLIVGGLTIIPNIYLPFVGESDGDGYIHFQQLFLMFEGLIELNIIKLFSFNLNYGFLYFFTNLLLCSPFIFLNNMEIVVFIPRLINVIAQIGTLILIYFIFRRILKKSEAFFLALFFGTIPVFWDYTSLFRPDNILTFLFVLSLYYFQNYKKTYWQGVFVLGLSFAIKNQAIFYMPLIFLLNCKFDMFKSMGRFIQVSKKIIKSYALVISILLICNPYLISAIGRYGYFRRFFYEVNKIASTSSLIDVFIDQIQIFNKFFSGWTSLLLAVIIFMVVKKKHNYFSFKFRHEFQFFYSLLSLFCINIVYIFFFTKNQQASYFFNSFICFVILATYGIQDLSKLMRICCISFMLLLNIMPFTLGLNEHLYNEERNQKIVEAKKNNEFIRSCIGEMITKNDHILVLGVPVDFELLNIPFNNLHISRGSFKERLYKEDHDKKWAGLHFYEKKYKLKQGYIKPFYIKKFVIISQPTINESEKTNYNILQSDSSFKLLAENGQISIFMNTKQL